MQESTLARMKMSDVWSLMELMDDGYLERGPPWLSWSDPVYVACFSEMLMPDPQMSIDTMGSDKILSVLMKFLIYMLSQTYGNLHMGSICGKLFWSPTS